MKKARVLFRIIWIRDIEVEKKIKKLGQVNRIGQRIQQEREKKKYSQKYVVEELKAHKIKMSIYDLSRIECRKRKVTDIEIFELAKVFGIKPSYFFREQRPQKVKTTLSDAKPNKHRWAASRGKLDKPNKFAAPSLGELVTFRENRNKESQEV